MLLAQLVHEFVPEGGAAFLEELGADRELGRRGEVPATPGAKVRDHRDELDRRLGEAVVDLLLVGGIGGARDEALVGETAEAVGEDVGGDALLGAGQQSVLRLLAAASD
jgi:hypothetical protein